MNRSILMAIVGIMTSIGIFAQSGHIVGKIVGTTTSNIDGLYKLEKIPCGIYTMRVNCIGYDSLQISEITIHANRKLTMNLELSHKSSQITEVIPMPLYIPKKQRKDVQ